MLLEYGHVNANGIIMNKIFAACSVIGFSLIASDFSYATEGGQFAGPIGGSDMRSAYLPPQEGLYLGTFAGMSRGSKYADTRGKSSAALPNGRMSLNYLGVGALYKYPGEYWGGSLASSASVYQAWNIYQRFGDTSGHETLQTGDVFSDLLIWSKYLGGLKSASQLPTGLTIAPALSIVAPVGSYEKDRFVNIGRNTWVLAPNVSFSYLTEPGLLQGDGVEVSGRFYYEYNDVNHASGYQSGQVGVLDWALTRKRDLWQIGVAGTLAKQFTDDKDGGDDVAQGNRMFLSSIGPVIARDFPQLGLSVKFKAIYPIHEVNRVSYHYAILQAGFKF